MNSHVFGTWLDSAAHAGSASHSFRASYQFSLEDGQMLRWLSYHIVLVRSSLIAEFWEIALVTRWLSSRPVSSYHGAMTAEKPK